ncbi:nucleotide-binding universal stress UspA family protein [Pseudomonas duriflava]|uniref:Nucleotide-binding universal stress UspA family protein n=1 Tax=Pseudomonas duriflava TaxID=459528 RepID=A0A562Q9T0_9PSED|nr:universal stress protein [Pseudomonas duriflava]TWI53464.1 nucleotide-binding universal stress UspA family protein [Pseudomonas duriflava]
MIQSILCATDLGIYSSSVLQHALCLARAHQAKLYVVHAVEPLGLFADSVLQTYVDTPTLKELREQGFTTVLQSIERKVMECLRDEMGDAHQDFDRIRLVRVIKGDPVQVILEQSHDLAVDLLVIGSHSHASSWGTPLGRTAGKILQAAEVPVYLVPMLQHRGHG